jgi:hypothetical protein
LKELQLYINKINSGVEYDYMILATGNSDGVLNLARIGKPKQEVTSQIYQEDELGDLRATAMPVMGMELQ